MALKRWAPLIMAELRTMALPDPQLGNQVHLAPQGADDPSSQVLGQPERIPNGKGFLPHLQVRRRP
jgi:hypothetical protein